MATQGKIAMRAVKTLSGVTIPRGAFQEKVSQTYVRGALVVLDANGQLTECGADPALIMGVAVGNGLNQAVNIDPRQLVELAHPGVLFRGYADLPAGEGTGVLALTDRGLAHGVAKAAVAPAVWFVDTTDVTADRVTVWDTWDEPGYALTDIRPHVYFSFIYSVFQGQIGL
jgi:hypothetical protein